MCRCARVQGAAPGAGLVRMRAVPPRGIKWAGPPGRQQQHPSPHYEHYPIAADVAAALALVPGVHVYQQGERQIVLVAHHIYQWVCHKPPA